MYKLVAVDMDGTLLKKDKTISQKNVKAITNARAKGVKIVLATGRPVKGINRYLKQLNLIDDKDYCVTFNGAIVQNTSNSKIIAENMITIEDVKYLYDISKKLHINIHALTPDACITPKSSKYTLLETTMNNIPLELIDFHNLNSSMNIVKAMFIGEEPELNRVIDNLPSKIYDKYTIVRSAPYFLEFLNKKVDKGFGVKLLADALGIKKEEVICIGDAGNDVHMIKYAGLGVAMGNAFSEVKNIADYITKTNEDDGVAHVINKFVLKEEAI